MLSWRCYYAALIDASNEGLGSEQVQYTKGLVTVGLLLVLEVSLTVKGVGCKGF